jgi:hypothetical protein
MMEFAPVEEIAEAEEENVAVEMAVDVRLSDPVLTRIREVVRDPPPLIVHFSKERVPVELIFTSGRLGWVVKAICWKDAIPSETQINSSVLPVAHAMVVGGVPDNMAPVTVV